MNKLLVGDKGCTFNEIVNVFKHSPSTHVIQQGWLTLARELETSSVLVETCRMSIQLERKDVFSVLDDLLEDWRTRLVEKATMSYFLDIIEFKCEWKDIAESLLRKFQENILEDTAWNVLDKRTQAAVLGHEVGFLGRVESLNNILCRIDNDKAQEIIQNSLIGHTVLDILQTNSDYHLVQDTIPLKPDYYIPRKLKSRQRLKPEIFRENCQDIFLVEDINPIKLSTYAGGNSMDESTFQLEEVTQRFIRLLFPEDFQQIAKASKNIPVHWLKYKNNKIYWVKTSGSLKLIQSYIHENQEEMAEDDFCRRLQNAQNNFPICIAASPGMGKSILLINLALSLKATERTIIFIVFSEFMMFLEQEMQCVNKEDLLIWIPYYVTSSVLGRSLLSAMLDRDSNMFEIFFDGFDEIHVNKVDLAVKILQCLTFNFSNVRVHVTTRLHKREQLEQAIGVLRHTLAPFQQHDQTLFLIKHWNHRYQIKANENLEKFASTVISEIRSHVPSNSLECDIAGIPLQCRMLAEIFEHEAKKYANATHNKFSVVVNIRSLHSLYTQLMIKRFSPLDEKKQVNMKLFHIKAAVKLLFPTWSSHLRSQLTSESFKKEEIDCIGIMEVQQHSSMPYRFLHRTYSEFLLAEFIVDALFKQKDNPTLRKLMEEFVVTDLLEISQRDPGILINSTDCNVTDVWKIVSLKHKHDWQEIGGALGISPDNIREVNAKSKYVGEGGYGVKTTDPLYILLEQWTSHFTSQPLLSELILALGKLKFHEPEDHLRFKYYKKDLQHKTLCFFLDACLFEAHKEMDISNFKWSLTPSTSLASTNMYHILNSCILNDFGSIFKFTSKFCVDTQNITKTMWKDAPWASLLITATQHTRISLLEDCYKFVELYEGKQVNELNFEETMFKSIVKTPLHVAVLRGDFTIFDFVFKKYKSSMGKVHCLLNFCTGESLSNSKEVINGKLLIIQKLLTESPKMIDEEDPEKGRTPLNMARVHFRLLEYLIAKGACASKTDKKYSNNVAHWAAYYLSPDEFHKLIDMLISKGYGDVFLGTNSFGQTPQHIAFFYNEFEERTIERLSSIPRLCFNNLNGSSETELFVAVAGRRSKQFLKLLVSRGGDPNILGKEKKSILHHAAEYGNAEAIEYFVSTGFDVNCKDALGRTPLHICIIAGRERVQDTVHVLLSNKANAYALDTNGHNPIWYVDNGDNRWAIDESTRKILRSASEPISLWQRVLTFIWSFFQLFNIFSRRIQ